jgi:hypothetical protein
MPRYPATKVPPSCENISIELAQQVLAESWGNISVAADALGVPSRDFRFLVRTTPALTAVAEEAGELYCDKAESILRDALESENELRRDVAARFVLGGKGAPRGWTRPSSPAVTIEQPPRQIVIKWLGEDESSSREGSPPLIDARPVEGDDRSSEQTLQRSSSSEDVGVAQALPFGPEQLSQRQDIGGELVGDSFHARDAAAAATPAVRQDAVVPEPASTPTLPVWPGPYPPPPPLVAHLYTYVPPQRGLPPQPGMSAPSRRRVVGR